MSVQHHQSQAAELGPLCLALITVSDTRTTANDHSGDLLQERTVAAGHSVGSRSLVRDSPKEILEAIQSAASKKEIDAILLSGGTGATRRDTTVDTLLSLRGVVLNGFGELFRIESYASIGPSAMLSRACAIVFECSETRRLPVFALPGSVNAVETAMEKLIEPVLAHLVWQCRN